MKSWQYTGIAPWHELYSWCERAIGPTGWHGTWETLYFEHEKDYTLFLLRWA